MPALVLDTGALIALDRDDPKLWVRLEDAICASVDIKVPVGALAQAWRDGSRQARLARVLRNCEEVTMDGPTARELGTLCGRTGTDDVIDASVALTAARALPSGRVVVLTSDRHDIAPLLATLDAPATIVDV